MSSKLIIDIRIESDSQELMDTIRHIQPLPDKFLLMLVEEVSKALQVGEDKPQAITGGIVNNDKKAKDGDIRHPHWDGY
jgi:hypothetical protein